MPVSHYSIAVDLEELPHSLARYENSLGLQSEPDFQRGHVWGDEQASRYMEYFIRGGEAGKQIIFNHPGWMKSYAGDFVLVDGLQRLTAARRFLANEIPVFGKLLRDFEDGVQSVHNCFQFCIATLPTRAEVLAWYIDINNGGTPHTREEIERVKRLFEAERKD